MDFTLFELLPIIFFIVALAYSSVGLGGGSSYTAIMVLTGINIVAIPIVSLTLNLFVSVIGCYHFLKNKHGKVNIILPFLFSAIPFAYIGGSINLPKEGFLWVLLVSLIFVIFRIYFWEDTGFRFKFTEKQRLIVSLFVGSILGLIAGIVGIGGGIYLVPLIVLLNLGTQKEASAAGIVFVFFVSLSGFASRWQAHSVDLTDYIPVITAVILGGFLGSYLGSYKLNPKKMEKILGVVIIVAVGFLIKKLLF
jgi:uncharacterized membrane protein YfcA